MSDSGGWIVLAWTSVLDERPVRVFGVYTITEALAVASYVTATLNMDVRVISIDYASSPSILSQAVAHGACRFSPVKLEM